MRTNSSFVVSDIESFKEGLLLWAQQYDDVLWLDGNGHKNRYGSFDALLAVDALTLLQTDSEGAFEKLKEYQVLTNDYIFGYLSYDLKNDVERLFSKNADHLHFPELYFFQPKKIIKIIGDTVSFDYLRMVDDEIQSDFKAISGGDTFNVGEGSATKNIRIKLRIFKDEYFRQVQQMLAHIHRGDIYEANFCQEFYAEYTKIHPYRTYQRLNAISKAPFAAFLKMYDKFLLSASPERYLRKEGDKIISQPIKGTAKRSQQDSADAKLVSALQNDPKERAENIMIVDLVRNDLSKHAIKGSVQVEELCEVYTFEQVHQMISTVVAEVAPGANPVDLVKGTFPMGSMTGAPKVSAMKIIEELEAFKRGLYSGAVGYFTPDGDFDFNVVIRSILYNASEEYVSYSVGGAITAKAVAEKEYEECLLKAKAMREVLES
ncbi:anthranilate synthase component I family protein [Zobellia galactanivorans]|uniref:anthranilate synthase component I family protein n=1 Tax=Zobellia galactanivorans (strain DSM 12802 / CCUG 47099 / CIP 106680 / NCIMB 13871 / Dsij) TaxID=63186 RepID=UPI0026E3B8EB|nr:anthranilate synthase component I family protein [Zobellia galactanivorans]MDO6808188.1 anthranilate synthase component I family protein [Zobellia galactanivorans]